VERVIFSSWHNSTTDVSRLCINTCAILTCDFVSWNLRPPFLPLARAAISPAFVRSRISSLSKSANEAKIPKISRPAGVVVSIFAPCPLNTRNPIFWSDSFVTVLTVRQRKALLDFPEDEASMLNHYVLSEDDIFHINRKRGDHNRLGFALQLCAFRYPGKFIQSDEPLPEKLVAFVSAQLGINPRK
jgi:hypothetical protein